MNLSAKTVLALPALIAAGVLASCDHQATVTEITSPDGKIALTFGVDSIGAPVYSVTFNGREAVADGTLTATIAGEALTFNHTLCTTSRND